MDIVPVIPYSSLQDTVAVLILLLSLPSILSTFALFLFILTLSSRSFTSKLFKNLFKTSNPINQPNNIPSNHKSFILISLLDIFLCVIIKLSIPNLNKLIFVLANSILSTSLTTKKNNFRNTLLSCFSIIAIDNLVKLFSNGYNNLFPYLSKLNYNIYFDNYTNLFSYIINFINLILSIHIILMGFSSNFKNNFISKNINQLSSSLNDFNSTVNFNSFLFKKETKNFKLINIDISNFNIIKFKLYNDIKESIAGSFELNNNNDEISTDNIVNENFQNFCKSLFTRPKNSIKSYQPLWSLIATIKVMDLRKHIYSGEEPLYDNNNSLILTDQYKNFYDELKFSNYDENYINNNKIKIFIEYIGETLILFNLKNFNSKLQNFKLIIRINGVIWYQVSKGLFIDDYQEILIISGLTPLSQYDIQFILQDNEKDKKFLIDDLIISTIDSKGSNITLNNSKIMSPLSTLQESLITTNENLNKERIKLKKNRKELTKKINSYKSDIETLKKIVNNSDKNDEKNYKKILSLRSLLKQVEIEISKINDELNLVEIKELETTEIFTIEKRKFDLNQRNFKNFEVSFNSNLNEIKLKLNDLNNELNLLNKKKELKSLKYNKILNDNNNYLNELNNLLTLEINSKIRLRNERIEKRVNLLNEFKNEIQKLENNVKELTVENDSLKRELYR